MADATPADWIRDAAVTLGLVQSDLVPLDPDVAAELLQRVGARFVDDPSRAWWWEGLIAPHALRHFPNGRGVDFVVQLVPTSSDHVFLATSNDDPPPWPVFRLATAKMHALLSECPYFEYLIIAPDESWIVGENHHDVVFAAGPQVLTRFEGSDGVAR